MIGLYFSLYFDIELVEFLSDIANEAVKVSFEFSCYDVHKLNVVDHSNYWKETANELAGDKSAVTSIKLYVDVVRIEFESRRGQ